MITYLRTDSTRISEEAQSAAAEYISATFGEEYKAVSEAKKTNSNKNQAAHEAIRPSEITRTPAKV